MRYLSRASNNKDAKVLTALNSADERVTSR